MAPAWSSGWMEPEPLEQAGGPRACRRERNGRKWRFQEGEQPGGLREHAGGAAESLGDGLKACGGLGSSPQALRSRHTCT